MTVPSQIDLDFKGAITIGLQSGGYLRAFAQILWGSLRRCGCKSSVGSKCPIVNSDSKCQWPRLGHVKRIRGPTGRIQPATLLIFRSHRLWPHHLDRAGCSCCDCRRNATEQQAVYSSNALRPDKGAVRFPAFRFFNQLPGRVPSSDHYRRIKPGGPEFFS